MARTLRDDLQILLLVQEADSRCDKARQAITDLDSGAKIAAEYNTCKIEFEQIRTAATRAHGEQKDVELRLASLETKRQQVEMAMMTAGVGARELENLQKELEMLERQRHSAEEIALTAMGNTGDTTAHSDELEKRMGTLAARYRKIRAAYKEQHTGLSQELTRALEERGQLAQPIRAAVLKRYDAIRVKKNGIGVVAMSATDECGACHTHLHRGMVLAIRACEDVQACEFCGRLLVMSVAGGLGTALSGVPGSPAVTA